MFGGWRGVFPEHALDACTCLEAKFPGKLQVRPPLLSTTASLLGPKSLKMPDELELKVGVRAELLSMYSG